MTVRSKSTGPTHTATSRTGRIWFWSSALAVACGSPALFTIAPAATASGTGLRGPPQAAAPRTGQKETPAPVVELEPPEAALPSQSDAPEPLYAKRTPLSEQAVAAYLAQAWQAVIGEPIQHGTLAVLWAHSALETGRGEKMLGFNFAGLKGQAPNGDGRPLLTWEHGADGPKRVRRTFRVYRSAEQGARDYIELLKNKYSRARRAAERGSPVDFVSGLAENDYFTHDAEQYTRSVTLLTLEYLKKHPEAPDSSESSVGALAAR